MANILKNQLLIEAPVHQVRKYLVKGCGGYRFNMSKLFPEVFTGKKETGFRLKRGDWFLENTGSATIPAVGIQAK